MLVVIAAVAAAVAFVVLTRRFWRAPRSNGYSLWLTLAAIVLVVGLAILAATGRLHWLAAAAAAVAPFLRRGIGMLRYLPLLRSWFGSGRQAGAQGSRAAGGGTGLPSRAEALEILGLGTQPTREEIIAAHRRLIQKLHPDRGGTAFLAAQLNAAKERLLQDL
jgi:DnaJ homolog subfamily C member 19